MSVSGPHASIFPVLLHFLIICGTSLLSTPKVASSEYSVIDQGYNQDLHRTGKSLRIH